MVLDFNILKEVVKTPIVDRFDHALMVPIGKGFEALQHFQNNEKYIEVHFQPTCENITTYIASQVIENLPNDVQLHSVRLWETPTSFAEWYAEDNC